MTADISRSFADRDKLFRSVVRQQGRLPTDSEENNSSEIATWEHDAEFIETIAPLGTPDDGFRITVPVGSNNNFEIHAGSFYLGGARIENLSPINYTDQLGRNWLTQNQDIAPGKRLFVWLEAEERTVTAFEDAELFEPALRGADGAARTRFCWRVRQSITGATDCAEALAQVMQSVGNAFDPWTGRIASSGTLTVGFDTTQPDTDLCHPAIEAGYLGNRNNCYRIKIADPGHFVWGEDDGSQLYRVHVDSDGQTLLFGNLPLDEYLRPRQGDVIELLRGDVLLPNFQRVAEPNGQFFKVMTGFAGDRLKLDNPVDPAWLAWLPNVPVDPDHDVAEQRFFHARVWRGKEAFAPGSAVGLPGTGLTMTFSGSLLPGDSWVCAARPDAPTRVLPWALAHGMRAQAPRRHVAGLAFVDLATGAVKDCRHRFRALFRIRSCCTITVAEPGSRRGDTDSIAAALEMLPPEGGTLCLLPGTHRATIELNQRHDIKFEGCGGFTRWVPEPGRESEPLVALADCKRIRFSGIEFEDGIAGCIAADRDPRGGLPSGGDGLDLSIERCQFLTHSGNAILARDMAGVEIRQSRVMAALLTKPRTAGANRQYPSIFASGRDVLIADTTVEAVHGEVSPASVALGGIQIGGGSKSVTIRGCTIVGGSGIGITLGSVNWIKVRTAAPTFLHYREAYFEAASERQRFYGGEYGFRQDVGKRGTIKLWQAGIIGGTPDIPVSAGQVEDVVIEDNMISEMGSSGIATYPYRIWGADGQVTFDAIAVERLAVTGNRITGCVTTDLVEEPDAEQTIESLARASGGITLSIVSDALFRDNEIANNGVRPGAVCGIAITYGEDIRIVGNRIEGNGMYAEGRPALGPNAGINIMFAGASMALDDNPQNQQAMMTGATRPALSIHGNIVAAPAGRAVRALALGPVQLCDNRLVGANPSRLTTGFAQLTGKTQGLVNGIRASGDADYLLLDLLLDVIGGDSVNLVNLATGHDRGGNGVKAGVNGTASANTVPNAGALIAGLIATARGDDLPPVTREGGETMVANNQIVLRRAYKSGPMWAVCSILILSGDDIAFTDNQYEIERNMDTVLIDAVMVGNTVRTTSNRGQEGASGWLSILSWGLMHNLATSNQSTYPLLALPFGTPTISVNNWSLN